MIVLYETASAQHNMAWIDELKRFYPIELLTWDDWSESGLKEFLKRLHGQSVFFRVRKPNAYHYFRIVVPDGLFCGKSIDPLWLYPDPWRT